MRGRLTLAALFVAAALAIGGFKSYSRGESATQNSSSGAAPNANVPTDRVSLSPAEVQVAAAAGFLPSDTRSILKIDRALRHGEFVWNDREVPAGPVVVAVDLRSQMISVFRAGHEIGSAVILYGAEGHESPLGTYPVRSKARMHRSITYDDAPMPFTLWLTDDGVAIHGSDIRWGVATHGCIGIPPKFAEHLFGAVHVGDPVTIIRSPDPRSSIGTT